MRHNGSVFKAVLSPRERKIVLADIDLASRAIAEDRADSGWYSLQVRERTEFAVENLLEGAGVHVMVPSRMSDVQRRRGRILPPRLLPVMMGYVLVRVAPSAGAFRALKAVEGVTDIVGTLAHPHRSPDREIMRFKAQADGGAFDYRMVEGRYELHQEVLVKSGPFASFQGTVTGIDNLELCRIRVDVSIFGRSTPVELDVAQIEKL